MKSDFLIAVTQLAAERNLPREMVISAVEAALVSAYKKDSGFTGQNVTVQLDPNTGDVSVFQVKNVVEEVTDPINELTVKEAKKEAKKIQLDSKTLVVGDVLQFEMPPQVAGRIAAQTAKQVVIQRLREAERELVYDEFSEREGEVFTGTVQRSDSRFGGMVTLDLNGRAEAVAPPSEQVPSERYRPGLKMKVLILEVRRTNRGPEIIASRTHPDLLRRLFEMEVPEIYNGIVEIRAVAREPGSRSKVAVVAKQDGVDPVGACVGLRGIRIQNIVNELQGEKIDVIQWYKDAALFIAHALSPAQPLRVELDQESGVATVVVSDRSLSLAIGREGQNARLAAKLTGWKVDIKSSTELEIERMKQVIEGQVAEQAAAGVESEAAVAPAPPESEQELEVVEEAEPAVALIQEGTPAELEAEIAAEEAAAKLSAEEELLQLLQEPKAQVTEVVVGDEEEEVVEELLVNEDEIWKVPGQPGEATRIRFAEEIQGAPTRNRGGGRRRRSNRPPARRPQGPGGGRPAAPAAPSASTDSTSTDSEE